MADVPSHRQGRPSPRDEPTRQRLKQQRRSHTRPEIELRRRIHRLGLRYFVDRPVEGVPRIRPDITFPRLKVAVFVDGCFWHSCPDHGTTPKNNRDWWVTKLASNVNRDQRATEMLRERGWVVIRIWEHEDLDVAVLLVLEAVESRRRCCRKSISQGG